jgi:hypothetical protein
MISTIEKTQILTANAGFIAQVKVYKDLLSANYFPLSVDPEYLKTVLRTQLFDRLCGVDKGLKMRFDMLKTNEAKLKLIAATIDLEGYDIVPQLESAVKELELAYNRIYIGGSTSLHKVVTFAGFADAYELNLATVLETYTYDFTGREHVLRYFAELGAKLVELRDIFRATRSTSYTFVDAARTVSAFYTEAEGNTVVADQGGVMRIITDLEKAGKLDLIPRK